MTVEKTVWCRTQFEGYHRWSAAPEEVEFLRSRHRHIFHVEVAWKVQGNDREIEFIGHKRIVDQVIHETKVVKTFNDMSQFDLPGSIEHWSCEHWACHLLTCCNAYEVTVSEDGENGATVRRIK